MACFFACNFVTNHRGIITQFDIEARLSWSGCSSSTRPAILDWQLMKLWPQCDRYCLTFVDTSRCHDWRPLSSTPLSHSEGQLSSTRGCWFIFMPRKELNRLAHSPVQLPQHIISSPDLMNFKWCGNFFSLFFSIFLVFVSSYSPSYFGSHSHFPAFARRPFFNCQNNFLLHFGAVCGWMTSSVCASVSIVFGARKCASI